MIIVDTGPLVAMLHAGDRQHERCLRWYDTARGPLVVPQTVVVEVAYLVAQRCGPEVEAEFARSLGPDGPFELVALQSTDMTRVAQLVQQYADFPLGTVDASVVTLAERLNVTSIATLDIKHFSAVRPRHVDAFTLHPQ